MDNRYYLQALGVSSLFALLLIVLWNTSGGPASEAAVLNAGNTKTAIAATGSYLLQPRTRTPVPVTSTIMSSPQSVIINPTSTSAPMASATNTSLLPPLNTPVVNTPVGPSITPLPSQTATVQLPELTAIVSGGEKGSKTPSISGQYPTPTGIPSTTQDPAEFARWYFRRVWNERDYQNLWDNYLTASYKANVGSGLFEDYVWWWNSVARVDVNSVDVLENNGSVARIRVNLTFQMTDGRLLENEVYEYDLLYDPSRGTWMFDVGG